MVVYRQVGNPHGPLGAARHADARDGSGSRDATRHGVCPR